MNDQYILELETKNKQLEGIIADYKKSLKEKDNELSEREKEINKLTETITWANGKIKEQKDKIKELSPHKERVKELVKSNVLLVAKYTNLETSFKKQEQKLTETDNLLQAEKEKNRILEEKYKELENQKENPDFLFGEEEREPKIY